MTKKSDECSDRELLIRIDERTKHLPEMKKKIEKHEVVIAVLSLGVVILAAKTFPALAGFIAR